MISNYRLELIFGHSYFYIFPTLVYAWDIGCKSHINLSWGNISLIFWWCRHSVEELEGQDDHE